MRRIESLRLSAKLSPSACFGIETWNRLWPKLTGSDCTQSPMRREHTKASARDLSRGPQADGGESVPVLARRITRLAPVPFADDCCDAVAKTTPVGYKAICK